jgi:hypothetical protein
LYFVVDYLSAKTCASMKTWIAQTDVQNSMNLKQELYFFTSYMDEATHCKLLHARSKGSKSRSTTQ